MNELVQAIDTLSKRIEVNKIAIAAIEKQIGKKPAQLLRSGKWVCSRCYGDIDNCRYYCDKCGQKIEWEVM